MIFVFRLVRLNTNLIHCLPDSQQFWRRPVFTQQLLIIFTFPQPFCDDTVNVLTFERAILVGLVFCSMYIIVGIIVDLVGKKPILVIILGGAGLCGISSSLVPNQQAAVSLFAIFQMSGACIGLTNAVVVELFPTRLR